MLYYGRSCVYHMACSLKIEKRSRGMPSWPPLRSGVTGFVRRPVGTTGLAFIKGLSTILELARLIASEFTEQAGVHGGGP
jgi:hypothetical protein